MADKRFDNILYDFFENQNGAAVLISEDALFKKVLGTTLSKTIGVGRDRLFVFEAIKAGLNKVRELNKAKFDCILFIERTIHHRPTSDTILAVKQLFPDMRVIVLVTETKRENIAYFYEIGVNNVISKPASVNNIIEKMAFTIKPQGKLSEYMGKGKEFLADGKLKEALEISTKILKIKPNSPAGLMLRGDVYLVANQRDKAIECYKLAHKSSHLYLEPLKKLADAYKGVDDEERLECLKKLDRLSPLNALRKKDIGAVYVKKKEMGKAEKYFDLAIETATKEAMALVGNVARQITEAVSDSSPAMVEKYVGKLLESKGNNLTLDDIALFNKMGIALRSQGKWEEAIENYKRALQVSPDDEGLYYNMGMAYYDGKLKREAMNCLDKALSMNSDFYAKSEVVCVNIGMIYYDMRRFDDATMYFETALGLNPNNSTAQAKLTQMGKL